MNNSELIENLPCYWKSKLLNLIMNSGKKEIYSYLARNPVDMRIMTADVLDEGVHGSFTMLNKQTPHLDSFIRSQNWDALRHRHDYFEMMFVLNGEIEQLIEGGRYLYETGSVCLLDRNTEHCELFSRDFFIVFLCLSRTYVKENILPALPATGKLASFFQNNIEISSDFKKDYIRLTARSASYIQRVEDLLNTLAQESVLKLPGSDHIICGNIIRLLSYLEDPECYHAEYNKLDSSAEDYIFNKVTRIMEQHAGPVNRTTLSEMMNYSSDYINRIVKKYTGMGVMQYNQMLRLRQAEQLLVTSDKSINQIMNTLGYENRSHFYAVFQKKHGMTPKEFREMNKQ